MASTWTVTRPIAVNPINVAPDHAKCSDQTSLRGSNSRTSWPVCWSVPATFGPLCALQCRQENARLSRVVSPPCWRAITWSLQNALYAGGAIWQYSHRAPARSRTCWRSLDSRITGFQRNSRVRLQNRQKVRDVQIAIQFGALLTRESAGRGAVRELLHSFLVFFCKIDRQQELGEVGRQRVVMCTHRPRPKWLLRGSDSAGANS